MGIPNARLLGFNVARLCQLNHICSPLAWKAGGYLPLSTTRHNDWSELHPRTIRQQQLHMTSRIFVSTRSSHHTLSAESVYLLSYSHFLLLALLSAKFQDGNLHVCGLLSRRRCFVDCCASFLRVVSLVAYPRALLGFLLKVLDGKPVFEGPDAQCAEGSHR